MSNMNNLSTQLESQIDELKKLQQSVIAYEQAQRQSQIVEAFLIVHTLVQQFENNIIYPRVVGSSVGLPGMWVIVAVSLGGSIGGIFGVLVAVPVAAGLYYILKRETEKRL